MVAKESMEKLELWTVQAEFVQNYIEKHVFHQVWLISGAGIPINPLQ